MADRSVLTPAGIYAASLSPNYKQINDFRLDRSFPDLGLVLILILKDTPHARANETVTHNQPTEENGARVSVVADTMA